MHRLWVALRGLRWPHRRHLIDWQRVNPRRVLPGRIHEDQIPMGIAWAHQQVQEVVFEKDSAVLSLEENHPGRDPRLN